MAPIDGSKRGQLEDGQVLVAKYKGREYRALVIAGLNDARTFRLDDGREFKSPSAAGSAVMNGIACNGWRFWSLAGEGERLDGSTEAQVAAAAAEDAGRKRGGIAITGEELPPMGTPYGITDDPAPVGVHPDPSRKTDCAVCGESIDKRGMKRHLARHEREAAAAGS